MEKEKIEDNATFIYCLRQKGYPEVTHYLRKLSVQTRIFQWGTDIKKVQEGFFAVESIVRIRQGQTLFICSTAGSYSITVYSLEL